MPRGLSRRPRTSLPTQEKSPELSRIEDFANGVLAESAIRLECEFAEYLVRSRMVGKLRVPLAVRGHLDGRLIADGGLDEDYLPNALVRAIGWEMEVPLDEAIATRVSLAVVFGRCLVAALAPRLRPWR